MGKVESCSNREDIIIYIYTQYVSCFWGYYNTVQEMRAILSTSDSELDHSILGIKPAERSTSTGDMQPTKNGYSSRPSPVKNGYDLTSE